MFCEQCGLPMIVFKQIRDGTNNKKYYFCIKCQNVSGLEIHNKNGELISKEWKKNVFFTKADKKKIHCTLNMPKKVHFIDETVSDCILMLKKEIK